MSLVNAVKVCMHIISLTNGWNLTKLAQIPYFQGHYIINTQKVSLVNAVKSLCAHYLFNQWLVLLDFGVLDFIFKVTPAL